MIPFDISAFHSAGRVLLSSVAPFLLVVIIASFLVGIFKVASRIDDKVLAFSARLLGVIALAYITLNSNTMGLFAYAEGVWSDVGHYY